MNGVVEELDRVADLCARLDQALAEGDLASRVLAPIAAAVGADTASLRCFGLVFYHHLGFCVQSAGGLLALDFHRPARSDRFGALERARARLVAAYLHAKGSAKSSVAAPSAGAQPALELTSREAEVAEAVAIGLSNKQVAESLRISVRTVENHLRSIFAKCNVATRTRLAAKLRGAAAAFRL